MIKAIIFDWGRTLYDHDAEELMEDCEKILAHFAKKYKLAIVSIAKEDEAKRRAFIREHNLESYFSSLLFTREATTESKGKLYEETLVKFNVQPHEVVIVDDRAMRGIQWGNQHGTVTVWFQNGKFDSEVPNEETGQPTHTIHALKELLDLEFE